MPVPPPRPGAPDEAGDAELIAAVRSGTTEAYGVLYERHVGSARALARQLAGSAAEADDLVAESFAKVLSTLRGGGGPDAAFRAYLLTTLRHTRYDRARRDRRLELSDDMTKHDPGVPFQDTAVAGLESALAARAFRRLPERWQTVLWHTEIEQESPAEVAPLLGLTPNGVAALAYRAREGLRQAYLQEHLADGVDGGHRGTVERLGAWARGGLSARQRARVDAHLAGCDRCRALATELRDVNGSLRAVVAPLVLGAGAAAYLATQAGGGAAAGVAAVAAVAAAGTAAAGGEAGVTAGAAATGTAVAGTAAAGTAAATAGTAGTAATTAGTVTAWVAGTHVGQAAAAAVAAVVIGGGTVAVTHDRAPARPAAAAAAAVTPAGSARPGPDARRPTTPAATTASATRPGPSRSAGGSASATGGPGPVPGTPTGTGRPTGPGRGSGTAVTTGVPGPLDADLVAGAVYPAGPLHRGQPGELRFQVRNAGTGPAANLVATVRLPADMTVRSGGSGAGSWRCTGAGAVATCTIGTLAAQDTDTVQLKVRVGPDTPLLAPVGGTVSSDGGAVDAAIPTAMVPVLAV